MLMSRATRVEATSYLREIKPWESNERLLRGLSYKVRTSDLGRSSTFDLYSMALACDLER